jgi:CheY-like chemotaxis protein
MAKVLVVDGDRDLRGVIKFVLVSAGYEVTESGDGSDALEKAHEDRPDLILLGLEILGSDAAEALKNLSGNPETSEIPIVLISSEGETVLDGSTAGVQDVISKPFTAAGLTSKVKLAIDKSRTNKGKEQPAEAAAADSQPDLGELEAEESQPAAMSTEPEPEADEEEPAEEESVEDSGEGSRSKPGPAKDQNNNEPHSPRSIPSAKMAATAIVLLLVLAFGAVVAMLPEGNALGDVDLAKIFAQLPMIGDGKPDKDYNRWDPWIDCVADSMHAARQEAIGLYGTEAGGIAVTESAEAGEHLGEVEQPGGRDADVPNYVPNC